MNDIGSVGSLRCRAFMKNNIDNKLYVSCSLLLALHFIASCMQHMMYCIEAKRRVCSSIVKYMKGRILAGLLILGSWERGALARFSLYLQYL